MPGKNAHSSKPKAVEAPPATTNFRQIKGINQLIEARLHRAGVSTFEELANLLPEEILTVLGNLKGVTVKQIVAQDWIGQALKLAGKHTLLNGSLGSQGFIVDIFLNKKKLVHSTQILHVSSDEGEKWEGWDSQRLLEFIINRSGLILPEEKAIQAEVPALPATIVEQTAPPMAAAPNPVPAPLTTPSAPAAELVFRTFEMIPSHSQTPSKLLRKGEPFDLRLLLETKQSLEDFHAAMDYTATIFAKDLDAMQRFKLGEISGVLAPADEAIVMNIPRQNLAPGTYRLEAALTIRNPTNTIGQLAPMRTIFQVY